MNERFEILATLDLRESARNTRRTFNPARMAELVASISEKGVITPLVVRPFAAEEGAYEIAAGHRRFRAAVEAGVAKVPAIIRDYTDQQFLEVLTVENLQREDVHPIEEASGYAELLRGAGWTVAAAAAAGHSSLSPWIRETLRVGRKRRSGRLAAPATLTDLEIRVTALEKRAS